MKNKNEKKVETFKCKKCGSINVAEILYGLPVFDEKLNRLIEENKVVFGGCEMDIDNPTHYCNDCKTEFVNW